MFKNLFSWNDSEVFYDEPEPDWGVGTAASQVIRYPAQSGIQNNHQPMILTSPGMDHRDPMPPRQVDPRGQTPRVIVKEQGPGPRPVIVQRVDRNEMQPAPMMRAQVPPALEYKVLEFRVPLCCEGCQGRVAKKLHRVRGVDSVHCDLHWKKVTVRGYAMPADVLRALRKMFKRSEYWVREPMMMQVPTMQQQQAMQKGRAMQNGGHAMQNGGHPIRI